MFHDTSVIPGRLSDLSACVLDPLRVGGAAVGFLGSPKFVM